MKTKTHRVNGRRVGEAVKSWKNNDSWFNCWGCTLFILDIVDELYWAENVEIRDFIKNETEEKNDWDIEAGDILVLWGERSWCEDDEDSFGIIHTAVYLTPTKLFHKVGGEEAEFATEKEVKARYYEYQESSIHRRVK